MRTVRPGPEHHSVLVVHMRKGKASGLSGAPENTCIQCQLGTYADTKGAEKLASDYECTLCEKGKFSPGSGYTDCMDCLGGDCKEKELRSPSLDLAWDLTARITASYAIRASIVNTGRSAFFAMRDICAEMEEMTTMTPCAQGSTRMKWGTACKECGPGKYASSEGSIECRLPPRVGCPDPRMPMPTSATRAVLPRKE